MKQFFKSIVVAVLTWEASLLLRRAKPKIIAVTGSVGKTSTKDAIYTVLKQTHFVRKSQKSFNSELGVPLTVLGLQNTWHNPFLWLKNLFDGFFIALWPRKYPDWLVLEMGVDRPGDMTRLCSWIRPDIVVITCLPRVPVHVEFFDSPESVADEKMVLVRALKSDGVLVYNHDDEKINQKIQSVRQRAVSFSRYSKSDFTATNDSITYIAGKPTGLSFTLNHETETSTIIVRDAIGVQSTYNYSAAAAVGSLCGISLSVAAEALKRHQSPPGRMRILPGLKDTLIIDDTYNSSPTAAERALLTLKEIKGGHRKIAVLGDMLELGQYATEEHEKLGVVVTKTTDVLLTIGVRARKIAKGAQEHGLSGKMIRQYDNIERAASELQTILKKGDQVLIKASQGIRAEFIVMEIMAHPEQANNLLVRQEKPWQSIK